MLNEFEQQFLNLWRDSKHELPPIYFSDVHRALPWCNSKRRFEGDFVIPDCKIVIEIQGGLFARKVNAQGKEIKMGHNSGIGIVQDCEKILEAALNGWQVIQIPSHLIKKWFPRIERLALTEMNSNGS